MDNFQLVTAVSIAAFAFAAPKVALAAPEWSCLQPALQNEMQAQLDLQDQFHAIVMADRPDLADVSERATTIAKLNIALTRMLQEWIWANEPVRLNTLSAYRAFSWNDDDRAAFVGDSADAQDLQNQLDDLNQQLQSDPGLGGYYTFLSEADFQAQLSEITESFGQVVAETRSATEACF